MAKITSYLANLKFDPNLKSKWYANYLSQIRIVILLIFSIIIMGLFGYSSLPRRLNPEIKIPIIIINTTLPGASPEDVESLVTIPIEDKLNGLKDVDSLTSSSVENASIITIQFLSTVDGEKAKSDVQSAVDTVTKLPTEAKTPVITKLDFEDQPIWNFALTSMGDEASLMRLSNELKKKIEDLSKVDRVLVTGLDDQQVEISLLPEKIKAFNLNPLVLSSFIQKNTNSYPAGNIYSDGLTFPLAIEKGVKNLDDLRELRLNYNGENIKLGDIASIAYKSTLHQNLTLLADKDSEPKKAVSFFVFKTSKSNIDAAEKEAKKEVESFIKIRPGFEITTISNASEEITKQFDDLTNDFFSTIILVFALLLIFLGLKQAIISSITVPLTFFSSFAIINTLGLSLNFLTMFAFLIALGLLIDDTIVTVAAMTRYYATGKLNPYETGVLVWRDFIVPLWSTTIATIWAFLPLLLSTGIIGEFIKSIPIVVTATMISSTSIAVLITIPLMIIFLKPTFPRRVKIFLKILGSLSVLIVLIFILPKNIFLPVTLISISILLAIIYRIRPYFSKIKIKILKNKKLKIFLSLIQQITSKGLLDIEKLSLKYKIVISRILRSKTGKRNTLIAIAVFVLCGFILIPTGLVKSEFFPKQNQDLLFVNVELPSGTSSGVLNKEAQRLISELKSTDQVKFVIAESGQGFNSSNDRTNSNNNILFTLHLSEKEKRAVTSSQIAQKLRDTFSNYSVGVFKVQEASGGPPAGADLQITLLGEDLTILDDYANKIIGFLKTQSGVTNVDKSIKPGTSKMIFTPEKDKLTEVNLSMDSLALWLRTYASGFTLDTIKEGRDNKDIIFQIVSNQSPEDLGQLSVQTEKGLLPLLSLGKLSLTSNPTIITRDSKKRSISVSASVSEGNNIADKNKFLEVFVKDKLNLASGYTWKTGGVNEENQKSVNSILQAMLISFLLILITMVVEFKSYRQTFIALALIPLSIAGVFYIFALSQTPLSFPALIGILALFGIVVTHAIVVIEKINENLKEGLELKDAIVDAAGNRLEPVLLTSLATIFGLVPITLSDPLWRGLGGAIIAGLVFSGAIKLFFVPVAYYLVYKK